jgi:hypothetical protein
MLGAVAQTRDASAYAAPPQQEEAPAPRVTERTRKEQADRHPSDAGSKGRLHEDNAATEITALLIRRQRLSLSVTVISRAGLRSCRIQRT